MSQNTAIFSQNCVEFGTRTIQERFEAWKSKLESRLRYARYSWIIIHVKKLSNEKDRTVSTYSYFAFKTHHIKINFPGWTWYLLSCLVVFRPRFFSRGIFNINLVKLDLDCVSNTDKGPKSRFKSLEVQPRV